MESLGHCTIPKGPCKFLWSNFGANVVEGLVQLVMATELSDEPQTAQLIFKFKVLRFRVLELIKNILLLPPLLLWYATVYTYARLINPQTLNLET